MGGRCFKYKTCSSIIPILLLHLLSRSSPKRSNGRHGSECLSGACPRLEAGFLTVDPLVQTNDGVEARAGCGQGKRPTTAAKLQVHHHHHGTVNISVTSCSESGIGRMMMSRSRGRVHQVSQTGGTCPSDLTMPISCSNHHHLFVRVFSSIHAAGFSPKKLHSLVAATTIMNPVSPGTCPPTMLNVRAAYAPFAS